MPTVSVLMPVFNRETLVGEAIESIQNQTLPDWELVILDDGSTDRSLEVCRSYEAADNRIRVHANGRNFGLGETRKRLMSLGSGIYFAMQDSDDISAPERLARSVEVLNAMPEIGLVTGISSWIDDQGQVFQQFPEMLVRGKQYPQNKKEMFRLLYQNCYVSITACMFRKSLGTLFPGGYRIVDDWHFLLQVAYQEQIWGIPEVMVTMRRGRNHSHLWKNRLARIREIRQLMRNIYEIYKDEPDSPIDYAFYRKTLALWLAEESKFLPSWAGFYNALQSVFYDPFTGPGWQSLWQVSGRAFKKARKLAHRTAH